MNDSQDEDIHTIPMHDLLPEQQERVHAAMHILMTYLLENGYLTDAYVLPARIHLGEQVATKAVSTPSKHDN